jgi:hypothetical protein
VTGAVADLVLVEQFLNTLDERTFSRHGTIHVAADELTSVDAWSAWLAARGLLAPGEALHTPHLAAALSLRAGLRAALTGDSEAGAALTRFPLRLGPDSAGRLHLAADTGAAGLDVIVEAVAASVAGGGWGRLKLCASSDCRWAFYDTSRNGGGRWCSMEVCGNRHKTRAFRQRRAG